MSHFDRVLERGKGAAVIEEIVLQSRVEINVEAEEQDILINEYGVENEVKLVLPELAVLYLISARIRF
jgi:hypothetical protein